MLSELVALPSIAIHLPEPRDARLRRVVAALKRQRTDERRLSARAIMAGASPRTLTRLFIAETGMTFRQWRRRLRFTAAVERLARREPVTTVILDLGYSSVSGFIEAFHQLRHALSLLPGWRVAGRSLNLCDASVGASLSGAG